MTKDKTVTMSRELIEEAVAQLDDFITSDVLDRLKSALAAPVVERQDAPFYISMSDWNTLVRDDVEIASVRISRTKRSVFTEPLHASPPAPVAVVLPTILSAEQGPHYSDNRASELGYLAGYNACLDKVKELN